MRGSDVEARTFTSSELDVADRGAVVSTIGDASPDVVINGAAYTAVDRAEADEIAATEVNGTAVGHLAEAADQVGALLVHVSTVVADQHGCPTSAADLSNAIVQLAHATADGKQPSRRLYHVAAPDEATWHDVAVEALSLSAARFDGVCRPIPTSDYPTAAARPANSRLDTTALENDFGIALPPWRESLAQVVNELESHVLPA